MQSTVAIRDYPCGSSKTTSMIERSRGDRKYLVIVHLLTEFDRVVRWSKSTLFQQPHANDNTRHRQFAREYGRYTARQHGDSGRTRTPNLLIRSQLLYPVELRNQMPCIVRRRRQPDRRFVPDPA